MADVEIETRDGVLRLTINDPATLNALTCEMAESLAHELEQAAGDDAVRAVLLTGAGGAFSSGANLQGLGGAEDFEQVMANAARLVRAVPGLDKPVVAAVRGVAAGVACGLALACDLVIAGESAAFLLPFTRVGLMPDGATTLSVAASIGRARAMRMALLAEPLPARDALTAGLVAEVVPDDDLDARVEAVLARLVTGPPLAHAATKRAINATTLGGLEDALQREARGQVILSRTRDAAEGIGAFVEGRRPTFTGE